MSRKEITPLAHVSGSRADELACHIGGVCHHSVPQPRVYIDRFATAGLVRGTIDRCRSAGAST